MPEAEAANYKYNIFDVTKVWLHGDYPLIELGKIVLDRNPDNYFAEVEQVAFCPSNFVPGIEASLDEMLQGRMFAYKDTQMYRLTVNNSMIPINCPYRARVINNQRDGLMMVNGGMGASPNYFPNFLTPQIKADKKYEETPFKVSGTTKRQEDKDDDIFEQPGLFWRKVLTPEKRQILVQNLTDHLNLATNNEIKQSVIDIFSKVDPEFGLALQAGVKFEKK